MKHCHRIAYTGASKTAQVLFRDLVSIEGDIDRNIIHTARRQNAIVIHYSEDALGLVLIRFFASSVLADNRLPNGWQLTARANGDQITLNVGKAAAVAA